MHPPRIVVLVTILGVLVTGCTPTPAPEPSPVPSVPTCVPEFGGEPFPCTQAEHDANQKMLARYAEAERVYREFARLSEAELVSRRPAPSPELMALTSGSRSSVMAQLRTQALESATYSGERTIVWVKSTPHASGARGNHSMLVCSDFSAWVVTRTDRQPGPSGRAATLVLFDDASGRTTVVDLKPGEDATCV